VRAGNKAEARDTRSRAEPRLSAMQSVYRSAAMPQRLRKLVGTIALVLFVSFYALTAMTLAAAKLPGASRWAQLVFFVVAGFAWIIPAGGLIYWMQKREKPAP
jgi:hypothetical protein